MCMRIFADFRVRVHQTLHPLPELWMDIIRKLQIRRNKSFCDYFHRKQKNHKCSQKNGTSEREICKKCVILQSVMLRRTKIRISVPKKSFLYKNESFVYWRERFRNVCITNNAILFYFEWKIYIFELLIVLCPFMCTMPESCVEEMIWSNFKT